MMPSAEIRSSAPADFRRLANVIFAVLPMLLAAGVAGAALTLGIELAPDRALPGEQLALEISVSNTDVTARTSVVVELVLPPGIEDFNRVLVTGPYTPGACSQLGTSGVCSVGETVVWSVGTLAGGQSATVTLPPIVAAVADGMTITFSPSAVDSDQIAIAAVASTTVDSSRSLRVAIDEVTQPVVAGGTLGYRLHYANTSASSSATNATLRLPLPAGTTFSSASDGGGLIVDTIEWSLGTLAPGESGQREVVLGVSSLPAGSLFVANAILLDDAGQVGSTTITEVDGGEALSLGLEVTRDPALPGEQLGLEATITNRDVSAHTGVTVLLRLPQGLEDFNRVLVTGPYSSGACTQLGASGTCSSGEFVSWSLGTLEAGQSRTLGLPPIVAAIGDGSLIELRALAQGSGSDDRAAASRTIAVDSARTLELAIDEIHQPTTGTGSLDYVLHYGNAAASTPATNATLRLPVPDGTSFVSASDGGLLIGDAVEWSLGSLAPGDTGRRQVALAPGSLPDGTLIEAEATLAADGAESRAGVVSETDAAEALSLGLEIGPDPARPGESLHVEATITNRDVSARTSVTARLRLPQGIEDFNRVLVIGPYSSGACSQLGASGTCSSGEFVSWSLGTLEPGQSETVTLVSDVSALADGSLIEFRADAASSGSDDRAAASRTVGVDSARLIELAIDETTNPVAAGGPLGYALHWANRSGTQAVPNATLRLTLPPETSFISASDGGTLLGDTVVWSLGTIGAQGYGERSVALAVDAGLPDATLLFANATLEGDSERVVQPAITEVDGDEALVVQIDIVEPPGDLRFLEATVHNMDVVARSGVWLQLRLSEGMLDFNRVDVSGPFTSGSCSQLGASGTCSAGEVIGWALGTIEAGGSATVALPPTFGALPDGALASFRAVAIDDSDDARASASVPEPSSIGMLILGSGLLVALARRRG